MVGTHIFSFDFLFVHGSLFSDPSLDHDVIHVEIASVRLVNHFGSSNSFHEIETHSLPPDVELDYHDDIENAQTQQETPYVPEAKNTPETDTHC